MLVIIVALVALIHSQPASAHGYLVRAIPEDRMTLERAPSRVQYWFSEDLEPEFSSLAVRNQSGEVLATGGVDADDLSLMALRLPTDLPDGAYVVELRPAFASDGHVVAESKVFFVGAAVGGVAGAAASDRPVILEVVWRALLLTASMLLFGVFTLYAFVLTPAWGSLKYPAGLLPPRVMRRLNWIVALALIVAIGGNLLALLQQSMAFFSADAGQVISQGLWKVVRIGSRFGDVWNARMFFLALAAALHGASIYLRDDHPQAVRAFWSANGWLMALVLGAFSVTNHVAGSLMLPWVGIAVDWLHTLGVGFWAGGLAALVLVLPVALQPYENEARRLALLAVLRRFSRIALGAVVIVVSSGIYNALNWVNNPADLTQTTYGGALLLKGTLVGGLLLVGLGHHTALRPERYAQWSRWRRRFSQFNRTLRLETGLVVVVLVSVAILNATPIPIPELASRSLAAPSLQQAAAGLDTAMTLSPGGPGVNTLDFQVAQNDLPLDGLAVRVQFANPERDWRSRWQPVEPVDSGLYVMVGDDINRHGRWLSLLDIERQNGETTRLVFEWEISQDAAVITAQSPGFLNILALASIVLAAIIALLPLLRRFYAMLDLSAAALTVVFVATAATALAVVASITLVQRSQQRFDASLNPPPQVVNHVLPDAASLERGENLYIQHCLVWQSVARDFRVLRERLPRTRDDELFFAFRDGWQALPPCTDALSAAQRWDVVNFFRTLGA